jgi:hypothetical protein
MNTAIRELSNKELIAIAPSVGATRPHSKVSDKYNFIPTINAVNHLRDSGWKPIEVSEVASKESMRGFQKHMIRFSRPDLVINGHRMDTLLYNSHNTGSSYILVGGVFRFVCSNGMVVGNKLAESRHRHVGFNPDMFIESARNLNSYLEKTAGVIDKWGTIELTQDEKGIYAQSAHTAIYGGDRAPIQPNQLLQARRYEDQKDDLWTTFNRVQENVLKGGVRGRDAGNRRFRTKPVNSIDKDKKLNQALWTLTEEMAKLKIAA